MLTAILLAERSRMPLLEPTICELTSLPEWEALLEKAYREVYLPNFLDENEREDLDIWIPRMRINSPPRPQPFVCILLAGHNLRAGPETSSILGIRIFELYRESSCGLLTYVAVHPRARRRGIASRMLASAVDILRHDAEEQGFPLRAIFAEVRKANGLSHLCAKDSLARAERIRILGSMGFKHVPVPYVQPALQPGTDRERDFLLISLPFTEDLKAEIPTQVIREFLYEFYTACDIDDPDSDPDFAAMMKGLSGDSSALQPLSV